MAKKDSLKQQKFMSFMFRGKEIFKPLNTGHIDERVSCIREYVANIYFYSKDGYTIMIDAGYNYDRLAEKMRWLDIRPESINEIIVTHQRIRITLERLKWIARGYLKRQRFM